MKMMGKKLDRPNREIIAIPRADGEDVVFIAQAILSYEEFDALVPAPKPGIKVLKGGKRVEDFDSPTFKADVKAYSTKRYYWMVLKSLKETPGLEWETVDYADPSTWANYEKELRDSGFSDVECQRILKGVSDANCLNEEKVDEARKRFLAGTSPDQRETSSSHQPELHSTSSGDVVKVGDSNLPESTETPGKS